MGYSSSLQVHGCEVDPIVWGLWGNLPTYLKLCKIRSAQAGQLGEFCKSGWGAVAFRRRRSLCPWVWGLSDFFVSCLWWLCLKMCFSSDLLCKFYFNSAPSVPLMAFPRAARCCGALERPALPPAGDIAPSQLRPALGTICPALPFSRFRPASSGAIP